MNKNDTLIKTLFVGICLCLFCSIIISTVAVELREKQASLKLQDQQSKILSSAGLLKPEKDIKEQFKSIEERVIDITTGEFNYSLNPNTFSGKNFESEDYSKNLSTSIALSSKEDISSLKRRENFTKVYLYKEDETIKAIILPIRGLGLWGTMYGYLAIESDLNTIIGLEYYSHKETPGLGAEVNNPRWKALWKGKKIHSNEGNIKITVIKGIADRSSSEINYQVDGLSGATITSKGVSKMLSFWLGDLGYKKFLSKLKEEIEEAQKKNV